MTKKTKLTKWRKKMGHTMGDAAKLFGISTSHQSLIESGKRIPSVELIGVIENKTKREVTFQDFLK